MRPGKRSVRRSRQQTIGCPRRGKYKIQMKEIVEAADSLLTNSPIFSRRQILQCQQVQGPTLLIQQFLDVLHFRAHGLRRAVEVPHLHLGIFSLLLQTLYFGIQFRSRRRVRAPAHFVYGTASILIGAGTRAFNVQIWARVSMGYETRTTR